MEKPFKSQEIFKIEKAASTNTYAASKLPPDIPEGSIIWVIDQTDGRGQGQNKWESEPGKNLTFSIILYPVMLPIAQQFYLSKAISLAIADFIALFTDNVSIKWPNDIYVGNGKIAGALIENSIEGEIIKRSIIGIGVNINQEKFSGNAPNPLSLKQLTNNEYDLDEMLDLLSSLIANRYLLIKSNEFGMIDENYHQVLYRIHQVSNYIADGELFRGTITGVEPNGALIIHDENKKIHKFLHKEVEYVL